MTLLSLCVTRGSGRTGRGLALPLVVFPLALVGLGSFAASGAAQLPRQKDPLDWPNWRGPQQISASLETGLPDSWTPKGGKGSNLLWKRSDLGTRSTPVVLNGKLYALVREKPGEETEGEKVVCVDAATGEELWSYRFNVYLTDTPDTRVAWSNVVADPETGRVYAQGVSGYFCCLEGDTGKLVWDHSMHEEYGFITTYGGRTNSPVVFEDQLLISCVEVGWGDTPAFDNLARPSHRVFSFDKGTGELRWIGGTTIAPPDTSFSTPTVTVIDGEAQLIFGGADGQVWGMQPRTGKVLWHYPLSMHGLNVAPLVIDGIVYMAHSLENMRGTIKGGVVAIDARQRGDLSGKEKWITYNIPDFTSAPIMVDGKLWVVDQGAKLYVLDPATGEPIAKKALGSRMSGSPLYADGKVYVATESGQVYILKPNGDKIETVHKLRLNREEINSSPSVSHGRIYLTTSDALYCIGVKGAEPKGAPLPQPPAEISLGEDPQPAWVQVTPYDILLKPGDSHKFTVRLFNSHGQLVRAAASDEAAFRVEGPGKVASDGTYTAPKDASHTGALVFCKVGALEGKARVRIVPPLPWQFNFNEGDNLPLSWIGGRVRYVLKEIDGDRAAFKLDVLPTPTNPNNKLGTRSAMYMGSAAMHDYTIQADVRLTEKDGRLPDVIGLINSGYTLGIRPGDRQLGIYSWASHDYRTAARMEFEPKANVWYRLKLRVEQQAGKALCQGKLWLRDQTEPEEWSLEMTDAAPQKSGSPGVFGNTQTTSVYVDNLSVVAND
ncbi:MAG TPA: PQQ-binding-like beta-propeller repeat protein [Lacipirellulaceae bacterium]|nr:PQQ-binding-like beta-propeller repeat protein [Lacipirellulaceae bacterium]